MGYRVTVTGPAKRDILENVAWWSENRSADQANRWFLEVDRAVQSLKEMPERYSYADERALRSAGVRQMGFGLGRRSTHRVLYALIGDEVVVYRIRSVRQDKVDSSDLTDS